MKYAQIRVDLSTQEDLATARANLMDFSESLKSGRPVVASKLETAFVHASAALANHHYFKSTQAVAQGDLKTAGRHLMLAADHVRAAARSANHEYGSEIVTIYDEYAPFGNWDETIVFDKNKLEVNSTAVKAELEKLATKLKAGR